MNKKKTVWITSKGEELSIEEMNSSHILNAIRKINSSTGWRKEWLPLLEDELIRRGMIARTVDFEKNLITDSEKMYFLVTSCEYQMLSVKGGSLKEINSGLVAIQEYIEKNTFCIPLEDSKDKFIEEMTRRAGKNNASEFMSYYENYLLINVFSKEWSNFMNLMLGRNG